MVALDWQQSAPYSQRPVEGGQDQPALCTLHCSSLVVSTAGKYAMEKKNLFLTLEVIGLDIQLIHNLIYMWNLKKPNSQKLRVE